MANLGNYRIVLSDQAKDCLEKISKPDSLKIMDKIQNLTSLSANLDVKKLRFSKFDLYRLRVGKFRAIYRIENDVLVVYIVAIGLRKDIYEKILKRI